MLGCGRAVVLVRVFAQVCHFVDVIVRVRIVRIDAVRLAICVVLAYRAMHHFRLLACVVRSAWGLVVAYLVTVRDMERLAAIGGVGQDVSVVGIPFGP